MSPTRRPREFFEAVNQSIADRAREFFETIDWSLSNREIARLQNCQACLVSAWRRRARALGLSVPRSAYPVTTRTVDAGGFPTAGVAARKIPVTNKRAAEAGIGVKTDTEVARILGISRERVRQIRNRLGVPLNAAARAEALSRSTSARYAEERRKLADVIRWLAGEGRTKMDISRATGVSYGRIAKTGAQHGIEFRWKLRPQSFWESLDWSKSNIEIAKLIGTNVQAIANWRSRLRKRGLAIPRSPYGDGLSRVRPWVVWANVDWTKSNIEIAKLIGVNANTISNKRSKLRKRGHTIPRSPYGDGSTHRVSYGFWLAVDWHRSNAAIAQELGMPRNRVSAMRCLLHHRHTEIPLARSLKAASRLRPDHDR